MGRDDSAHRIASLHDAEDDEAEAPEDRTALISTAAMDTLLAESKDDEVPGGPKATPLVPASPEALIAAPPQGAPALRPAAAPVTAPEPRSEMPAQAAAGKGRALAVVIAVVLLAAAGAIAYKFSQASAGGGDGVRLVLSPGSLESSGGSSGAPSGRSA